MSDFPSHEAAALPIQLPGKLVGRETALAQVYGQLKKGEAVHLYGAPGVGKTALAATLASAYAQQPGGVLWLNVDNDSLDSLLVRVGRAYEIEELMTGDTPAAHLGAVASELTRHKPLLVLDGTIHAEVASRFVARVTENLPVILVSRDQLEGSAWTSLEITPLEADAAVTLFKQDAAMQPGENPADADIRQLVALLGYLPFSIGVAARAMLASKQTPAAYTRLVQQAATTTGGDMAQAVLALSFAALNNSALQGLVLMLGATFKAQVSAELLSMVANAPVESVQQAMKLLAPLKLVEQFQRIGQPYYRLHAITYAFAQSRLSASNRLADLQHKIRDSVVDYAKKHAADADFDKLTIEADNFIAAAREAAKDGNRDIANQLVLTLTQAGNFISERGFVYEVLQLRATGSGSTTAFPAYPQDAAPNAPEDALPTVDIAALLADDDDDDLAYDDEDEVDELDDDDFDLDDEDEADDLDFDEDEDEEEVRLNLDLDDEEEVFAAQDSQGMPIIPDEMTQLRSTLAQARQQGDAVKQVDVLRSLARQQLSQDMNNEAIATYNEALSVYESTNDKQGMLDMLEMLSALMVKTENSQAAVLNATRGVKLAEELDDKETQLQMYITLGDARQQLGESDDAVRVYEQALQIARNTNDSQHEALILYKLGYAQLDNSDPDRAIDTWEQALKLFRTQEKRDYEGKVLGGLGSAYGELERWAEAINFHTSALYISREVGDDEEEALQLSSLGYACMQGNQLGQAVLRYRQALHLAYKSNDKENIVSTIVDLARLLMQSKRHLSVAELLIDDALTYETHDKDVNQLKDRIKAERLMAAAEDVPLIAVNGTAQLYAENAYKLLDE